MLEFVLAEEIEMDARGSVSFVEDSASIKVGEIKTSIFSLEKAKHQLAVQAKCLSWSLEQLIPNLKQDHISLEGHIFVNKQRKWSGQKSHFSRNMMNIFVHQI